MEKLKKLFLDLNTSALKIMKIGLIFSFAITILGALLLFINIISLHTLILFQVGLAIIKLSFYFAIEFVVCGFIVDKIMFNEI